MSKRNKILYSLCIDFLVIVILVSIYFIYYFYSIKDSDVSTKAITIKEKNNMSYKVSMLKESTATSYLTNEIDDINTNFSYSITFDKEVEGEYTYIIKGYLAAYNNDKKVLNREIYNSTLKSFDVDGNVINIADSINIDFDKSLEIYNNFKNTYEMNLTSYISYDIKVFYSVYNEYLNKNINNTKVYNIKATLSDNVSKIGVTPDDDNKRKEYSDNNYEKKPVYLAICLEFLGVILLCLTIIIYIIRIIRKNETEYEKYKNYILQTYDKYIVGIKELPNLKKIEVLFVDEFKDLIDAAKTLNMPINYTEVVKGHEATFIVIHKKRAYVYKLSDKNK